MPFNWEPNELVLARTGPAGRLVRVYHVSKEGGYLRYWFATGDDVDEGNLPEIAFDVRDFPFWSEEAEGASVLSPEEDRAIERCLIRAIDEGLVVDDQTGG